jgi:hypothetical protein
MPITPAFCAARSGVEPESAWADIDPNKIIKAPTMGLSVQRDRELNPCPPRRI